MNNSRWLIKNFIAVLVSTLGLAALLSAEDPDSVEGSKQNGFTTIWKKKIGSGYSGVTVADGRAVTMYSGGESDVMAAFDTADGRTLWTHVIAPAYKGYDGSHDGPISTPAIADGRVIGLAPRGELFALDAATGLEIWSTHLANDHGAVKPYFGFGVNPHLEDSVLVLGLGGDGQAVVGFDPATGEKLWSSGTDMIGYQSPMTVEIAGRRQVMTAGGQWLFGLDARSGEILWQWEHGGLGDRRSFTLNPLPLGGERFFLAHSEDSSKAITVRHADGNFRIEQGWEARSIRNSYARPVVHDGYLYGFSTRILACADTETGELQWRSRQPGDGFLELTAGGELVILTKRGALHVAEASPAGYREIAGRQLFDDVAWTPPSLIDGDVYARSLGEIARVRLTAPSAAPTAEAPRPSATVDSALGRFLEQVEAADDADKEVLVDRFLAAQESFPIVEGKTRAHFVYHGAAEDVALYGDMFGLRVDQPMARLAGTDIFHYSLELESDARLNYIFVKDFEPLPDPRNPRRTTVPYLNKNREMALGTGAEFPMSSFAMPDYRVPAHLEPAPEASRGRMEETVVRSTALGREIPLGVYLPAGYDAAGDKRYGVAYVYLGAAEREKSGITNSLDNLAGKTVEPLIVIFVDFALPPFGFMPMLALYERALIEEIVPFVDGRYKTNADASARANLATLTTANLVLAVSLRRADVFGRFAVQSVMLTDELLRYFERLLRDFEGPWPRGYLDWGKYDLRSHQEPTDLSISNAVLAEMLRQKGIELAGAEVHDGTGWISWSARNDRVFEALFPRR